MRKIFLLLLILSGTLTYAQHKGFTAVTDPAAFRTAFSQKAAQVTTIRCDFTQEKHLSLLAEKILSKGKFWFKKETLVRMEYQHPFQYLLIINGKNIYIKDGQKENRVSVRSNKLFQKINQLTIDCIKGTVFSNPDFSVKAFENKQQYLVEMTPVSKDMLEFFSTILVRIDRSDYAVSSINMMEKGGDFTLISFHNKEVNQAIADAIFQQK
ncbi:outer membrane lipoprotein carrier protein LolA [Flavihumibacter sp. CACIAM 22H1]|uniref:outer membrane lipoprotein carrier protein LolA n=1 Tax=Flavihumibacter sp. CACIAM 22H1 TaxID=1812911 RepID=UPI0007A8B298|nr:outer membrane lipoprotein carrier protein LolA [Flavihumibacter sp. CACIAM 22H1]KYP14577.1 MAG: cell envelope biogenesis protein LolA [Flavihumibacter sp. CACIAM 22H1]